MQPGQDSDNGLIESDRVGIWEEFEAFEEAAMMQCFSATLTLSLVVQSPKLLIVFKTVIVAACALALPSSQPTPEKQQ